MLERHAKEVIQSCCSHGCKCYFLMQWGVVGVVTINVASMQAHLCDKMAHAQAKIVLGILLVPSRRNGSLHANSRLPLDGLQKLWGQAWRYGLAVESEAGESVIQLHKCDVMILRQGHGSLDLLL